ncbi:hypothetical protein [Micromonospora sp. SH-82]|uniref:hypothetical protein n=1 Tax=Micromonospora sp. SH-82 TaxID=3132938 RepID=UPI003EB9D385
MVAIGQAVGLGRTGQVAAARDALGALWNRVGPDGDPLHRCAVAHYLADLQDTVESELEWDRRALAAVTGLTDERVRRFHTSLRVRAFLPSLHLNLADAHRRLGDLEAARSHNDRARALVDALPDDEYGATIRFGIERVGEALEARTREPLVN